MKTYRRTPILACNQGGWKIIKRFKEARIEQDRDKQLFRVSSNDPSATRFYYASRADAVEAFVLHYILETEGQMMNNLLKRDPSYELYFSETMQAWERWRGEQQARVMERRVTNPD